MNLNLNLNLILNQGFSSLKTLEDRFCPHGRNHSKLLQNLHPSYDPRDCCQTLVIPRPSERHDPSKQEFPD